MNDSKFRILHSLRAYIVCLGIMGLPIVGYANLPVIDATQNVNMIVNISNQVSQYKQMIEEAVKYEKELAKLGIDTGRVGGILGQLDSMTNGILTSLQAIDNLPDQFVALFTNISNTCNILKQNEAFKNRIAKETSLVKNITESLKEQTACLNVLNDTKFISEETNKYFKEAKEALKKQDWTAYKDSMQKIADLKAIKEEIQTTKSQDVIKSFEKVYSYYHAGEGDAASLSKKEMIKRLNGFLEQAKKATTQTDAQNLGNQMLVEILNMLRMNYDMTMEFNNAMIALQGKNPISSSLHTNAQSAKENEGQEEDSEQEYDIFASDSPLEQYKGEYAKNALGLPDIGNVTSNK